MVKASVKLLFAAALLCVALGAQAAQPYSAKAFQDAQAAGKGILINVYAPWCPVCKVQRPIIQSFEKSNPQLMAFEVDFDKSKDVLKKFGVRYQSTLIVFKGKNEVGRSTGETAPAAITDLLEKGL
jgi:thioredoxin 1